jgi:predicted alpha/beta superfamily hydrolase
MKRWIVVSSMAWSLALVTHESPAQPAAGTLGPPAVNPPAVFLPPVSTTLGPVTVVRSTAHRLESQIVDDVYEVRVSIPEDYDRDEELRPVIYALDGQWNFTLLSDIVGKLSFDGSIPDPIVVGITWADTSFQPGAERARDFTPEAVAGVPNSGGAPNFMQVLEKEIFPLVESNYRASNERVLTGGSLGGLFVSYALLERPDLFKAYIASSGATSAAPEYFARRLAEISPDLLRKERAFFSVGALYDTEAEVRGFVGELEAAVGESPRIVLDVVAGVGHTGNEAFAYIRGLLHAFQRPRLPLSEHFLERYEGDYFEPAFPDVPDLTIEAERGKLYIVESGERWEEVFYAETPTHFYAEGLDSDITFYVNEEGKQSFTYTFRRTPYEQVRR